MSTGPSPARRLAPTTEPAPTLGAELVGRWAHYDVVAYEDDVLKTLIRIIDEGVISKPGRWGAEA